MAQYFFPALMIAVSIGIYVLFIDPLWQEIQAKQSEVSELNQALENADQIIRKRDELQATIRAIPERDLDRLNKMLPEKVDNVRLTLEIEQLASRFGLLLKDANIESSGERGSGQVESVSKTGKFNTFSLGITLEGRYEDFREFIAELDRALRVVDVTSLSISGGDKGIYQYIVSIKTYWIQP